MGFVGYLVGEVVGNLVGTVGDRVGNAVGNGVGYTVGVGKAVGYLEGKRVGYAGSQMHISSKSTCSTLIMSSMTNALSNQKHHQLLQ